MTAQETLAIAFRLLRSPRDLVMAALVLSVGVGALSATFAIVEAVLLRPLPYRAPGQLIRIWDATGPPGVEVLALDDIDALHSSRTLVGATGFAGVTETLATQTASATAHGQRVTGNLFEILGARPSRGRLLRPADDRFGAEPIVILNQRLASVLSATPGETVTVNGQPHRVAGIVPEDFWFPDRTSEFWIPIVRVPRALLGAGSSIQQVRSIARLSEGATPESAASQLESVLAAGTDRSVELRVQRLEDKIAAPIRTPMALLQIGATLLALLTVLNAAWLFRVHARRSVQPFAVMMAIGASARGVAGVFMTQAALVALVAAPVSLVVAQGLLVLAGRAENGVLARFGSPVVNGRVMLVAVVAALLGALVASVPSLVAVLRRLSGGEQLRSIRLDAEPRWRVLLTMSLQGSVVFAVAVQAVILVLILRSIFAVNVGFRETRLVGVEVTPGAASNATVLARQYQDLSNQLNDTGIASAVTSVAPLTGVEHLTSTRTPDRSPGDQTMVRARAVTPSYFVLCGLELLAGRLPALGDGPTGSVVVDRTFATQILRPGVAVGQNVILGDAVWEVSGVVSDVHHASLFDEPRPTAYIVYGDVPRLLEQTAAALTGGAVILSRQDGGTGSTVQRMEVLVNAALPGASITKSWQFDDLIWMSAGERPLMTIGATTFALIATLILGLGLNGMLIEHVESRRREIALRASLGAGPRQIGSEMLLPVCVACGVSIVGGGLLATVLGNTILSLAFAPGDRVHVETWLVAMVSIGVLAATAAIAVWYPTSRALQLNPAEVLRLQE